MADHGPQDWIIPEVRAGKVIVQIGQVAPATVRQLDKLVRSGELIKWRGKWFPIPGALGGIGPDKTCWGLRSKFAAEQAA